MTQWYRIDFTSRPPKIVVKDVAKVTETNLIGPDGSRVAKQSMYYRWFPSREEVVSYWREIKTRQRDEAVRNLAEFEAAFPE